MTHGSTKPPHLPISEEPDETTRFAHSPHHAVLPLNRDYFEAEHFPKEKIDIVFLEFFDWSDETREILNRMTPDHIVFMHLPPGKEKIEQLTRHLEDRFPRAVIFQEPMQARSFRPDAALGCPR
jgi:hypothetical protein